LIRVAEGSAWTGLAAALALVLALATAAYSSCGDRLPLLGSIPALGHGHRFL